MEAVGSSTLAEQRDSARVSSNDEALLVLCDETKRSRLEEYLASPVFGCLPIEPSAFQASGTPPLPTPAVDENAAPTEVAKKRKRKRKRAVLDSVCLLFLRLPRSPSSSPSAVESTVEPTSAASSPPPALRQPSAAFGAFMRERLFHHPFLYRYAKSFYIVTNASNDLDFLQDIAHDAIRTNKVLRLCVFPKSRTEAVVNALPAEVQLHPKQFTHVLSIARERGRYYYGLAPKELFWGPESGVHSVQMDKVSRAYHKMKEVFTRIDCLRLADTAQWTAIDVGAAPGGWTQYLSPLMKQVISIDPGELRIELPPNVVHLKKKVEDCMEELRKEAPVDMLACDMNMCEALQAIEVMLPLAPLLRKGGYIVMTWKLPKRMDVNLEVKTEALRVNFAEQFAGFEIVQVIWLLANMYERTVVARKIAE